MRYLIDSEYYGRYINNIDFIRDLVSPPHEDKIDCKNIFKYI